MHEEGDFQFPVKDSVSGVRYGTKKGHPVFEFIPTGLTESRGSDRHRPGIIISRVFEFKKHRQRVKGAPSRMETTYSFSDITGIIFAVQLKGVYWASTPPPDVQEYKVAKHYMTPLNFVQQDYSSRCVYNFLKPEELKNTIYKL